MAGRMNVVSSMIIDDLDIRWAHGTPRPFEADAPLHVDPDAVLAGPVALQGFETVASKRPQFVQRHRSIENFQSAIGLPRKALEFPYQSALGEGRRPAISIAKDHPRRRIA